jgi:hypothetical protein
MKTGYWLRLISSFVIFASMTLVQQPVLSSAGNDRRIVPAARVAPIELLPLANPRSLTAVEQAYLDSFSILRYDNSCSQFFGGSFAIAALNRLTEQLRPTRLDRRVGMRMKGEITIVTSALNGFTFRLFDKAEVNLDGPFYQGNTFPGRGRVPRIGPFEPNTREARVTTVLHELGHLVRSPDGRWVLPNDGSSWVDSEENTRRVIHVCGEQIRALHNFSFEEEFLGAQAAAGLGSSALNGPG